MITGRATEALQLEVQKQLAIERAAPDFVEHVVSVPPPDAESNWWLVDENNKPQLMKASEVQSALNGRKADGLVMKQGDTQWVHATTVGFTIPSPGLVETEAPVVSQGETVADHSDPREQKLETFPDIELKNVYADIYGASPKVWNRSEAIKELAKHSLPQFGIP